PCSSWTLMPWMRWRAAGPSSARPRRRAPAARSPWTARHYAGPARPMVLAGISRPHSITLTAWSWDRSASRPRRTRSRCSLPCWTASTWLERWSRRAALHAQRAHADYLVTRRQAHYLITVKRNQPGPHAQLAALPWRQVPSHARPARKATDALNGEP